MLMAGRVDYIIGTPVETVFLAKEYGISEEITFVPVEEGEDYFMGYVACSKIPWGREAIKEIDKVLLQERNTAKYRSFFERWMPKEMIRSYRKAYKDIFLNTH